MGVRRLQVTLLDYGVGNVRSVRNAIKALGFSVREVASPADLRNAERLVPPSLSPPSAGLRLASSRVFFVAQEGIHCGVWGKAR